MARQPIGILLFRRPCCWHYSTINDVETGNVLNRNEVKMISRFGLTVQLNQKRFKLIIVNSWPRNPDSVEIHEPVGFGYICVRYYRSD